jgi:hypothetical protein
LEEEDLDPNRAPKKGMLDIDARSGRAAMDALMAACGWYLARAAKCEKLKSRDEKRGLLKRMSVDEKRKEDVDG